MTTLQILHTADVPAATLRTARALLDGVFADRLAEGFTDDDWDHCLGGMHVLLFDGSPRELIGHACVIQRRLLHGGRSLRTGYVDGVGVRADHRGRGLGATLLTEAERLIRGGYELGALSAVADAPGFYAARGWQPWEGSTWVLTPEGRQRTPEDDGGVFVLPVSAPVATAGELTCDWRAGDVW